MLKPDSATFISDVYNIVGQIPHGKVTTYGNIAALAGWSHHSRLVGRILRDCPDSLNLPCHRVVNSLGRTAPDWIEQTELLKTEGVVFKANGCVDLSHSLWTILQKTT